MYNSQTSSIIDDDGDEELLKVGSISISHSVKLLKIKGQVIVLIPCKEKVFMSLQSPISLNFI